MSILRCLTVSNLAWIFSCFIISHSILLGSITKSARFKENARCVSSKTENTIKKISLYLDLEPDQNKDIFLNITQLIVKYGYTVDEYTVVTEDGYILKMFRIPGSGPAIFLMHGLFKSSDDWVSPGGDKGVAFLLAAQGYDVWLGNARGNRHSMNNVYIKPNLKEFWDFSWHEIGLYDTTAMIDLILEVTGTSSLIYVGHSQGATSFYVMCSLRPEYNSKISLMISLSSIAWISNTKSMVRLVAPFANKLYPILENIGFYKLFTNDDVLFPLERALCGNSETAFLVCETVVSFFGGLNKKQVNFPRLPVIFTHFPTGSALKQFVHYTQLIESGYFRQFDYGLQNIQKYKSSTPPSYPVGNITAPVAIFSGRGDILSVKTDVDKLVSELPNVVDYYTVTDKNFDHSDFLWAKDIKAIYLPRMLQLIEKYKKAN